MKSCLLLQELCCTSNTECEFMLAKAHFIHVFLKPPPVKSIALLKSLVRNVSGTAIVPPLLIPVDIAVS